MRVHTLAVASAVTVLALSGLAASSASATPGSGTSRTDFVDYALAERGVARGDGIKLKNRDEATVRTFTLTYAVGGESGWHEHPGIVLALVKSGTVERQLGCRKAVAYTKGDAFTESGLHFVRNSGTEPAVLEITAIFPAGTDEEFRQDRDEPKCRSHS